MKRFIKADSGKFGSENQIKFFYKRKFLGSCDPDYIECPELLNLLKSDKTAATQVLNYLNSMGDPVFPVSEEKWSTPETNIDNIDIDDLYATFMQELDYEYADMQAAGFGFDVYSSAPGGWDFEIFDGPTVDDVESSTKIKASRYDNVPGYKAPESGYLYIFKHGIGPGTLPKDVEIIKTKDLPNYYTAVWLSDFLTTDELKKYDIPDETRINELLGRIGYCQKNGDVVPCDDVEACGDIKASTKYMANMVSASDDGYEQLAEGNDSESEEYIEYGKYYVAGYLQNSYRGLMEDLYSDDFEEILTSAADMAGQGLYVEITNRVDGRSKRYTPDDFEDAASYGEYPDHIREDLAL